MSRHYPDFINAYLTYTERTEPPLNYHLWTCLSIMGGAMQRKTYLRWGFKTFYPNLYVVLIGPSGCRKGTAMGIGKELLQSMSAVTMASESVTREALIRYMKEATGTFMDPTDNIPKFHCSVTVHSEELSVFLGQGNIKFLADLTDWFDCHDTWEYRTKGSGVDKLTGICLNILGATAPDWLRSILPPEAFGGGFTSRIIFVVEEKKRQLVADPRISSDILAMRKHLVSDLEQISLMAGEMSFTEETWKMYTQWYTNQAKAPVIKDSNFAGYCERRAVHALKTAMICSASRGNDRIIYPEDFQRAVTLLETVEERMPRAFVGLGKARYAEITSQLFDYLTRVHQATRSALLDRFHNDLDEYTLQIVMKTLQARRVVDIQYDSTRNEYLYIIKKGEHDGV